MDEAVVEVVENTPSTTPVAEPQEPVKTEPEAKSTGGRPAGAKDKAPRKKKVVVVAEALPESRTEPEQRQCRHQSQCERRSLHENQSRFTMNRQALGPSFGSLPTICLH